MMEWLLWLIGALLAWGGSGEVRAWRAKRRAAAAEDRARTAEDRLTAQWRLQEAQSAAQRQSAGNLAAAKDSLAAGRRDQLEKP